MVHGFGEDCDLTELDRWKQRGFYASAEGNKFVTPQQAVQEGFATAVNRLASRFITTIDFILKAGNLERYFDRARRLREKLSEADHEWMEKIGSQIADEVFGPTTDGESAALGKNTILQ